MPHTDPITRIDATARETWLETWLEKLEQRHLGQLTFQEVRRGLQALSRIYVQNRGRLAGGAALNGAGKRAAFALFYGPIHLVTIRAIVDALGGPVPTRLVDLGCGTGVGAAAWALARGRHIPIDAVDLNRWAVREANQTYRDLGLTGRARSGDLVRYATGPGRNDARTAILAAYTVNELDDQLRERLLSRLIDAWHHGAAVLLVEPIARGPTPWWNGLAARLGPQGAREDLWELSWSPPPLLERLDQAAGLDHRSLKARTFFLPFLASGDPNGKP